MDNQKNTPKIPKAKMFFDTLRLNIAKASGIFSQQLMMQNSLF